MKQGTSVLAEIETLTMRVRVADTRNFLWIIGIWPLRVLTATQRKKIKNGGALALSWRNILGQSNSLTCFIHASTAMMNLPECLV